jgi:hypothetical protein
MGAHADIFPHLPAIVKTLPDPIDQMKFFELIQIIPTPTISAMKSGNLVDYRISGPTNMGYLRNNSIFAFGQADRARTSATVREILDAMWLFNAKFEKALARFDEIRARLRPKSAIGYRMVEWICIPIPFTAPSERIGIRRIASRPRSHRQRPCPGVQASPS